MTLESNAKNVEDINDTIAYEQMSFGQLPRLFGINISQENIICNSIVESIALYWAKRGN